MPQANDAELTRVVSTSLGTPGVEDDEPNTGGPGASPATSFYINVEGVAGNVKGNDKSDYTLYLSHVADTGGPALANFVRRQDFSSPTWRSVPPAGNFVTDQQFTVNVPAGASGHVYYYEVRLVSDNFDVVSFKQSNRFILV
jgi:hypothetical protein